MSATVSRRGVKTKTVEPTVAHLSINAGAGCGKTSTMEAGYNLVVHKKSPPFKLTDSQEAIVSSISCSLNPSGNNLFVCFNKSISEEFIARNLPGSTNHSLGNKALSAFRTKMKMRYTKPSTWKTVNILEAMGIDRKKEGGYVRTMEHVVSLCKSTLTGYRPDQDPSGTQLCCYPNWESDFYSMVDHYGVEIDDKDFPRVLSDLPKVLQTSAADLSQYDFDDMIWIPTVRQLPMDSYDTLIVDERQDLNAAQLALLTRCGKQLFGVGDPRQSIYGFAGADAQAFAKMDEWMDANGTRIPLPLMETRRCPKSVVQLAQTIVPEFRFLPDAPEGRIIASGDQVSAAPRVGRNVPWSDLFGDTDLVASTIPGMSSRELTLRPGDMALCRLNAPLVQVAYGLIRRNIPAAIQGRDFGQGIQALIRKSKSDDLPSLIQWVEDYRQRESAKIQSSKFPSEAKLQSLDDKCDCLIYLTEGCQNIGELVIRIETLFVAGGDRKKSVLLSSVHRAKGLEAERVFILAPEKMPLRYKSMLPWQMEQEDNLRYVAWTRTKRDLIFTETPKKKED